VTLAGEEATHEHTGGQAEQEKPRSRRQALVEWVVIIVVALVAALLIKTFAIQAFYIPSLSMYPTLHVGDRVLVNKLSYDFHKIHVGDVIVFRRPPKDTTPGIDDLIKRVVAVGGETMQVKNCGIYVNGKEEAQKYLPKGWQNPFSEYCTTWDQPGMINFPNPYKVPKGYVFVMGDNRRDSYDSRYWGALPDSYIVGRAFVRIWPVGRIGLL
jgi:signal peptidase I